MCGVVGSTRDRARRKAAASNLPQVYDSFDDLLKDAGVDVIHIASPNYVHAQQAAAALAAGKHVVCEKPLGLNSTETSELVRLATASGLVNAVCFNIRFYPLCHQMRSMVASNEIGEPRLITGSYFQDWLLLPSDWNWRLIPEQAGELRAVADIGSHWLDLARFITGRRVVEVMADLHTLVKIRRHPPAPVETFASAFDDGDLIEEEVFSDDACGILLRYEDGVRGAVTISQVSAGRKNSLDIEVNGSVASVAWGSEDPDRLWIGHRGRPNEILQRDPSLVAPAASALIAYPAGHVEGYPDTFRALFSAVYSDIERGKPSPTPAYPTFADGHDAAVVCDAIALSSATRAWTVVSR